MIKFLRKMLSLLDNEGYYDEWAKEVAKREGITIDKVKEVVADFLEMRIIERSEGERIEKL